MSLTILWTEEATITFDRIVEYIHENWGERATKKFIQQSNEVFKSVSSHPYIFKASRQENIRQGFITKQTSFFYKINSSHIIILYFWDNRQDPLFE